VLSDATVEEILVVGRTSIGKNPARSRNPAPDVGDLSSIEDHLTGYDACFHCLGVSSAGMKEAAYRKITYDLTVAAGTTIRLAESGGENRILDSPAIHASAAGSPAR
jgi:hypothetical protein